MHVCMSYIPSSAKPKMLHLRFGTRRYMYEYAKQLQNELCSCMRAYSMMGHGHAINHSKRDSHEKRDSQRDLRVNQRENVNVIWQRTQRDSGKSQVII